MLESGPVAAGTKDLSPTVLADPFSIAGCPRDHVYLAIGGDGVVDQDVAVPANSEPLRVEVVRKLRFRIRTCSVAAERFALRDADDQRLASTANEVGTSGKGFEHRIYAQASPVYEVDDRAVTLVLLSGYREIRRMPLNLTRDVLNELGL